MNMLRLCFVEDNLIFVQQNGRFMPPRLLQARRDAHTLSFCDIVSSLRGLSEVVLAESIYMNCWFVEPSLNAVCA